MAIVIRTNLESDEEKNAKYKTKAEVIRKAYKQDSVVGGTTRLIINKMGDNILLDYIKGADVYLSEILSHSNYNLLLDKISDELNSQLSNLERFRQVYKDIRIKDKLEWIIDKDDKPYIFDFFNELRLIEREVNNHAMNGNYFTYRVDKFIIRAYRAKGYFSTYYYMIKSKEMEIDYDIEFYKEFGIGVSEEVIQELRQMLLDFYTPDVNKSIKDLSHNALSTIDEFFQIRDENLRYLVRVTENLGQDSEIHFGDLISTILNNYHITWRSIKKELEERDKGTDKLTITLDLSDVENALADRDYRMIFELVKEQYYNLRGNDNIKKTGIGVKR